MNVDERVQSAASAYLLILRRYFLPVNADLQRVAINSHLRQRRLMLSTKRHSCI